MGIGDDTIVDIMVDDRGAKQQRCKKNAVNCHKIRLAMTQ